jgi:5-methylcytosine-specific restriction endonuclease McrA
MSLQKSPRVRLDADAYQQLRLRVLERDGWRCQRCGAMTNLQVHHLQLRSHQGEDRESNLIALCSACHEVAHSHL